jgi:hypothetical protein
MRKSLDFLREKVLPFCKRVEFSLSDDDSLVRPAGRDELANQWHLDILRLHISRSLVRFRDSVTGKKVKEIEIPIHLIVLNQSAAENNLRNQNQGDDVPGRFSIIDQRGNKEASGYSTYRSSSDKPEVGPEHSADFENKIANQYEKDRLGKREQGEGNKLGNDVVRKMDIKIPFPLEYRSISDDVIGAVGQAEEHGDNQG